MIYVVRVPKSRNTGDNMVVPTHYFDFDDFEEIPLGHDVPRGSNVIVAGGGLIKERFVCRHLQRIVNRSSRAVVWGAGTNYPYARTDSNLPKYLFEENVLAGIRDAGFDVPWLPCVSCMAAELDIEREPFRDVVCYFGSHEFNSHGIPVERCNRGAEFSEVLDFLGSARIVVTSSYHGMYWASLLGRSVVVVPSVGNSKFYHWPFAHVRVAEGSDWLSVVQHAIPPGDLLPICRDANRKFYHLTREWLGLPSVSKAEPMRAT